VGLVLALAGCGDHTGPSMNDAGPVSDATPTDADGPGDDAQVPACTSDDDCDNDVPCQARERCDLTTHTCEPIDPLDDGDACAPDRICDDGLCVLEVPTECTTDEDCDDGNSCNGVDFCDTDTGTCQVTTCNDGDPCTDNVCNTDGPCDFLFIDQDGDGYAPAVECTDPALKGGDCDDTKSWVNPGAEEVCDLHFDGRLEEVDNNCDGYDGFAPESGLPNLYFRDRDEDSYGDPNEGVPCPLEGYVRGDTPTTGSPGAPLAGTSTASTARIPIRSAPTCTPPRASTSSPPTVCRARRPTTKWTDGSATTPNPPPLPPGTTTATTWKSSYGRRRAASVPAPPGNGSTVSSPTPAPPPPGRARRPRTAA
jgi:hypothetical protein